ncbi:hypothetical protein LTR95_014204, partial [Oleoguttula sp. CCFEE 5521]
SKPAPRATETTTAPRPELHKKPSASRLPKRMTSAAPQTPPNAPQRRPFFPGGRNSATATAQPRTPKSPPTNERYVTPPTHPSSAQRSLLRMKSPTDGLLERRKVTEPKISESWATPETATAAAELDFGFDNELVDAKNEGRLRRQTGSPSLRSASIELQRKGSAQRQTDIVHMG